MRIYYRAGLKTVASAAKGSGSQSYYEDKACPSCKGRGGIACPQKGCIGGAVTVTTYRTEVLGFGELRQEKRVPVQNKERCPNCNGRGFVDCQGCVGGIDRFLNR